MSFQLLTSYHNILVIQIGQQVYELAKANTKNDNFVLRISQQADKFVTEIRTAQEFNDKSARNGQRDFRFCFLIKADARNELGRRLVVTDKKLTQCQIGYFEEFIDFREDNRSNLERDRYWKMRNSFFQQKYTEVRTTTLFLSIIKFWVSSTKLKNSLFLVFFNLIFIYQEDFILTFENPSFKFNDTDQIIKAPSSALFDFSSFIVEKITITSIHPDAQFLFSYVKKIVFKELKNSDLGNVKQTLDTLAAFSKQLYMVNLDFVMKIYFKSPRR
jgi:hypothetical protein